MSHIIQHHSATNIGFNAHITNFYNFQIIGITHLHCTKVFCFVHGKQPFCRDNMVGGCRINNPFNIIISNMLTLLLFNRESTTTSSSITTAVVFFSLSLFSYFPLFCSLFQYQQSLLKWPLFLQWNHSLVSLNWDLSLDCDLPLNFQSLGPLLLPLLLFSMTKAWYCALSIFASLLQTSSLKIKSRISSYLSFLFPAELLTTILMAS